MATTTANIWQGPNGGDWNTATNWSQGIVGGNNGHPVQIPGGSTIKVTSNLTLANLETTGTGAVTLTGSFSLGISTSLVLDAGTSFVLPSGTAVSLSANISMSGSGTATLSGGVYSSTNNIQVAGNQTLIISGGATVSVNDTASSGTIELNGASLTLKSASTVSATIAFAPVSAGGTGNSLTVPSYAHSLTITGFSYGDSISTGGATLELVATGVGKPYKLETTSGTVIGTVTLAAGTPGAGGAPVGSTPITLDNSSGSNTYPCFYPGTMLATAEGEVAVEHVTIGMLLKTVSGALKPVRWVGWSEVSTVFADPLRVLPIRIQAGALAEGVPARDLLVSPDHALFMDGVLVQAGALVNGVSIIREENVPVSFRYYHVELETHELLLAEGAPAESFVDNIDRMHFHNWDAREAPSTTVMEMAYPRVKSKRQLPADLRAALAARAEAFAGKSAA